MKGEAGGRGKEEDVEARLYRGMVRVEGGVSMQASRCVLPIQPEGGVVSRARLPGR